MTEFWRLATAYPDAILQRITGQQHWLLWTLRIIAVVSAVILAYCLLAAMASIPDTPGLD
jgi:hypothetical protein